MSTLEKTLRSNIAKSISAAVAVEREELIAAAVREFEQRVRRAVGIAALDIAEYYSVQRLASDLIITVKIGDVQR